MQLRVTATLTNWSELNRTGSSYWHWDTHTHTHRYSIIDVSSVHFNAKWKTTVRHCSTYSIYNGSLLWKLMKCFVWFHSSVLDRWSLNRKQWRTRLTSHCIYQLYTDFTSYFHLFPREAFITFLKIRTLKKIHHRKYFSVHPLPLNIISIFA